MKSVSVIDLGTNTAHIIIAEQKEGVLNIVKRKRHYTFLAEHGINILSEKALKRLDFALDDFHQIMKEINSKNCVIIGTEAFRIAENGEEVLKNIKNKYGWNVEIISGEKEANLIFEGVRQVVDLDKGNYVIMDIGGGSVEFIISKNGEAQWKKSFPIGIANIYNTLFSPKSLNSREISSHTEKLKSILSPLSKEIKKYEPISLIGAAGSFEILSNKPKNSDSLTIERETFLKKMDEVINLSEKERAKVTWIPKERIKYVTAAILLIKIALDITKSKEIIISPYALKEGLAATWFKEQNSNELK